MKALITAGGRATRLRPITHTLNKHLIPLANKPMLELALEKLQECGITEVGINVNPGEQEIQKVLGDGSRWGMQITYLEQRGGPKGLAHIVSNAEEWLAGESFLFYLGDNIILGSLKPLVERFEREDLDCLLALAKVRDPQRFGVPEMRNGKIIRVVEKPQNPPSDFAVTGIYLYKPIIMRAAKDIQPSPRGEFEISDAHTWLINHNYNVGYEEITGWWKDTGKPEDLLEGNCLLLDLIKTSKIANDVVYEEGAIVSGIVEIGAGTVLKKGTVIRGPATIGSKCVIGESTIGPYVSIGNGVAIERSHVERSIVMDETVIIDGHWITKSIFGRNVTAKPVSGTVDTRESRYILGDHAVVEW